MANKVFIVVVGSFSVLPLNERVIVEHNPKSCVPAALTHYHHPFILYLFTDIPLPSSDFPSWSI
jgi:hypothetical protein